MTEQRETGRADIDVTALAVRITRPIVLVGMMGVGKTTVGRRLAALLERSFVDVDAEIELAAGRTVAEIFEDFGEDHFRDGERRVIARLMREDYGVIATGGGAFVDERTRALILAEAIAVWLDCDVETLVERTGRRDSRPLLRGADPHAVLTDLRTRREPSYAAAHCRVTTGQGSHHATVLRILKAIEPCL